MTCAGKSRVLYEFSKAIPKGNATFQNKKSPSCRSRVAYPLIITILKSNFKISGSFKSFFSIHHLSTIQRIIIKIPIISLYEAFPILIEAK
ncbi:MAG: hypothetical protein C4518_13605 [Desulfobacteraceae bacterium]|nr:MAG: hypothetical protein C4518_13605 [Desulfobacteraceae bacterium]